MEKIYKREDGSRVKLTARIHMGMRNKPVCSILCEVCEKDKRKFNNVCNSDDYKWRSLDFEDRKAWDRDRILEVCTLGEQQALVDELWLSHKPELT
jgi:hypothetical protein